MHTPSAIALRERSSLQTSTSAAEEALATAQNVSNSLLEQRRVFEGMQDRLVMLGEKFPAIGGLLTAIRRKKSKDTIVLGSVIGLCCFLMLIYFLSR